MSNSCTKRNCSNEKQRLEKKLRDQKKMIKNLNSRLRKEKHANVMQRNVHQSQSIRFIKKHSKADTIYRLIDRMIAAHGNSEDTTYEDDSICDVRSDDVMAYIRGLQRHLRECESLRKAVVKREQASDEHRARAADKRDKTEPGDDAEQETKDQDEVVDGMAEDESPSESADGGNQYNSNDNDDGTASIVFSENAGERVPTDSSDAAAPSEEAANKGDAATRSPSTARAELCAADQKQQKLNEQPETELNDNDVASDRTLETLSDQNLVHEMPADCPESSTKIKDAECEANAQITSPEHANHGDEAALEMGALTQQQNVLPTKQHAAWTEMDSTAASSDDTRDEVDEESIEVKEDDVSSTQPREHVVDRNCDEPSKIKELERKLRETQAKLDQAAKYEMFWKVNKCGHTVKSQRTQIQMAEQTNRAIRHAQPQYTRENMNPADDRYICWDFNSAKGCAKGGRCYWSHRWLVIGGLHPWTYQKMPGIEERLNRDPNCMDPAHGFHDNGRTYWRRNSRWSGPGLIRTD